MNGKAQWLGMAAAITVLGALAYLTLRPAVFPNVAVGASEPVTIDQLRGERNKLVVALLIPGDVVSKAALQMLKVEHATHEGRASFAGLVLGDPDAAAAYQKENDLPFKVYSLNPPEHPVEYNQVVKTVGGFRKRFFGGTVVVLDRTRRILKQVNGDELEELPANLKGL